MAATGLGTEKVRRLADDVQAAILADEARIAHAESEIRLVVWHTEDRFDIDLTTTTRAGPCAAKIGAERIRRLAGDVHGRIIAKGTLVAESSGPLTIRIFPRGIGFEIGLSITA